MTTMAPTRTHVTGGVDTHRDFHVSAALDHLGGVLGTLPFPTTPAGYRALLAWLSGFGAIVSVGAEGTGSYGAALAQYLSTRDVTVFEVGRPNRQVRRRHGKTAWSLRARRSGSAPTTTPWPQCSACPCASSPSASRVLEDQKATVTARMRRLTTALAPELVAKTDVGPDTATTLLITAGDNPERLGHEKSFAALVGAAPIPVNSGQTQGRVRLNRGGDRDANSALWRIAIVRMATDQDTRDYVAKRQSEAKTKSEAIRCLNRYIAREVYNALPFQAIA